MSKTIRAQQTIAKSISQFIRVLRAIMFREIKTRYSNKKLGYLWVFFEPSIHIAIFVLIRSAIGIDEILGVPVFIFFAYGFSIFFMFRKILTLSMKAIDANRNLLVFRQIHPFDIWISRAVIELFISIILIFIFTVGYNFFSEEYFMPQNIISLVAYLLILWIFAIGTGMVCAIIYHFFNFFDNIMDVLVRFLYFTSALMYAPYELGNYAIEILSYNPICCIIESIRHNIFENYKTNILFLDTEYIMFWCVCPLFLGFALYKKYKKILIIKK